ncbi:MAG: hypothetical protein DMG72_21370, partial [Acidobacteria bacterium]
MKTRLPTSDDRLTVLYKSKTGPGKQETWTFQDRARRTPSQESDCDLTVIAALTCDQLRAQACQT